MIVGAMAAGPTVEQLLADFPYVEEADILEALAFAARLAQGHEVRHAGYEAIHWSSVGSNSAKDGEICDYARQSVHVLLTNDLDFLQILAHTKQDAPRSVTG
jgi:predicted nuclease of predicted toxin-antitoxin system